MKTFLWGSQYDAWQLQWIQTLHLDSSNVSNPFNYQKFGLRSITIYRNGSSTVGTPLETTDNKRAYFNSLASLAYDRSSSHGIPMQEYDNHYILVFDMTSTLEASHEFIHPELTNSTIGIELSFTDNLTNPVELFLLGEKASTIFIDSVRNISKNVVNGWRATFQSDQQM